MLELIGFVVAVALAGVAGYFFTQFLWGLDNGE